MSTFADSCRIKASRTALAKHQRFIQRYNRLVDIRHAASTRTKRLNDTLAHIPKSSSFIFSLQLKLTLDSAAEILPNFISQFIDLQNRFNNWHEASSVTLGCLSRVISHILQLVKTSETLGKLNDIDFESFHLQPGIRASFYDATECAK